ncbi:MAG TPA: hypothetical protein VD833_04305 [Vicinamibacterales bacterium]|nr:hypothetical protein [Vicinamibacterales bacterium]
MTKSLRFVPLLALGLAAAACSSQPTAPSSTAGSAALADNVATKGGRAGTTGVVYVTSQGLYYDTFVTRDPLPMQGKFQQLIDGQTEFGPGDPEYLGGRWWEDLNPNGIQDPEDHFFLCPLLPPGRPTP